MSELLQSSNTAQDAVNHEEVQSHRAPGTSAKRGSLNTLLNHIPQNAPGT